MRSGSTSYATCPSRTLRTAARWERIQHSLVKAERNRTRLADRATFSSRSNEDQPLFPREAMLLPSLGTIFPAPSVSNTPILLASQMLGARGRNLGDLSVRYSVRRNGQLVVELANGTTEREPIPSRVMRCKNRDEG